jgi:hypothetical protein
MPLARYRSRHRSAAPLGTSDLQSNRLERGLARFKRKEVQMNRVKKTTCIFMLITTPLLATAAQNAPKTKPSTEHAATEKAQPRNPLLQKITSVLIRCLRRKRASQMKPSESCFKRWQF